MYKINKSYIFSGSVALVLKGQFVKTLTFNLYKLFSPANKHMTMMLYVIKHIINHSQILKISIKNYCILGKASSGKQDHTVHTLTFC